jgi:hypothetical protein
MSFSPDRILATLARHHVEFVLIGGVAAALNGSPLVTFDVDITPRRTKDNLERLSSALDELEARFRTGDAPDGLPFAHDGKSLGEAETWNLTTSVGDLDVSFVPTGTWGFHDLTRDAVTMDLDSGPVVVACLADIVRSKEAAGREKDRAALPVLRRLLEEQAARRPPRPGRKLSP